MPEEEAKKEESKSEEKKESDLAQLREQVNQVAPLVKPLAANGLDWINAIPIVGGAITGGATFWFQQSIFRALVYFLLVSLIFDFILPLRNSVRKQLQPHLEALAKWLVDGGIAWIKRDITEIRWRYAGKERKFLEIQGFDYANDDPEGLNMGLSPLLKDIFVPLELSTTTALKVPELLTESFDPSVNLSSPKAKTSRDGLQIWTLLKLGKTDPTYRRLLIKAKGGLGKTTLLRHIVYTYSQTKLRRGIPKLLPVLIRLRDWDHRLISNSNHTELKDLPIPDLANLIQCYIEANNNLKKLKFSDTWAKEQLENGKMLILWDGFDEVTKEWQGVVSEWLGKQMQDYPQSYFILTSRPHWYNESYSERAVRPNAELYVKEFNLEQIEKFIDNWYLVHFRHEDKIRGTHYPQDYLQGIAAQKTQNLIVQLQERPELKKLAEIPLNLNMIVNLHRSSKNDTLPRRRAELYQEIMNLQLIERPGRRDIDMVLQKSDRQKVLQHLALWMGKQGNKRVEKTDIDNICRQFITENLQYSAQTNILNFIEKVVRVSEILVKKDQDYEFAHLSFQSYLMAVEIKEQQQEELLINSWQQSDWWRDTAKLYAASQRNPSIFLRRLVALNNEDATALAKECLSEIPQDNLEPELLAELKAVEKTVQNSLYQQLETFLKNGQWKEADGETDRLMLQIVGKEADQWLSLEDIENFPCDDLRAIDKLWVDYSNGKFGFSVQNKVWMACGGVSGRYDWDVYEKFADQVGWRRSEDWLSYSELTFLLEDSKRAHLPGYRWGRGGKLMGVSIRSEFGGGVEFSFFAQRLATCNISRVEEF